VIAAHIELPRPLWTYLLNPVLALIMILVNDVYVRRRIRSWRREIEGKDKPAR